MTIKEFDVQVALGSLDTLIYWLGDAHSLMFTITLDGVEHDLSSFECRREICLVYKDEMLEDRITITTDVGGVVHISTNRLRANLIKKGILTDDE